MPTFIDESGDTGPLEKGGTPYFRLAAVWVPGLSDDDKFRLKIQQLRFEHGLSQGFEFKYSKTHRNPDLRKAFFTAALSQEFRFAFSSIDKRDPIWSQSSRFAQHWACVTELAAILRSTYEEAELLKNSALQELIVVDDNADQEFLEVVKRQFRGLKSRRMPGSSMIGKVVFRNSLPFEMLQLVDMVCGAVGSANDGNDRTCYDLIVDRSLNPL